MRASVRGVSVMSRYIDADKLMADLEKWKRNPNNDDSSMDLVNHFQGIIQAEPTADVIPRDYYERVVEELCRKHTEEIASMPDIVRCKECKWNENTCLNHGIMKPRCKFTDYVHSADDFCSYGERKESE